MTTTARAEEAADLGSVEPKTVDLGFLLAQATHVLQTELTAALASVGITPRSRCVLMKALPGTHTQIQLADLCQLDKTTMVVTLDELEKAGLVERQQSPTDRRARIIAVTDKGRRVHAEASVIVDDVYRDVLAALPADERAGFTGGLERLVSGRLSTPVPCLNAPRRRL